ncbi:MAG TPA: LLM class flavin-dependent oxidoreductase [Candidatus Binataceae bacterium]|nr:LLM class flavin-dependent oxidoreductase [Candidatus Binataceae bacterium]
MKAGVLQFFSWPERRVAIETVYDRALQRIEIMDSSGYDAVWLAEHHFHSFSVCPSVHMMAVQVAGRTRRLRIGTAVSLAAFYHPLRLAEEVALLDILSGGRVNWGAGRGFDRTEFRAFGVTVEESARRFQETVDIVLQAWTNERLSYAGQYYQFEDVEVLPKPRQQPHPPVWLAASSPEAIVRAAARGFTIMMDPHASFDDIANKRELYRRELERHGFSIDRREIPMARFIALARTEREAEEVARRGTKWLVSAYAFTPENTQRPAGEPSAKPFDPAERYMKGVVIYGTPESVVDKLARLREEMFLDYLLCAPLSHQSFLLFTDKVLPRLG